MPQSYTKTSLTLWHIANPEVNIIIPIFFKTPKINIK